MTDKQNAIAALSLASQSCTAALAPLQPDRDTAPLHLVRADLDSLLALLYSISTKLALALKPSAPSYAASIPLLHDLAQHLSALTHCVRLLRDDLHGAALVKDIRDRVAAIVEALRALIQSFLNNAARGPQIAGEEYLVRTGTLHDLITDARGPSGIPESNRAAVHKSWKSDGDSLDDNLKEIAQLIKEAENPVDADEDLDDGWNEIGLGRAGTRLDEVELARAKNVHGVLRLTTLLHNRISLNLLPYPSDAPVSTFDSLLALSNQLLSISDDLVASLYTPQDLPYVHQEILHVSDIATSIHSHVALLLPPADQLSEQLRALTVDDRTAVPSSTASTKKRKWFDTCVDQIVRLCSRVSESTIQTENHDSGT